MRSKKWPKQCAGSQEKADRLDIDLNEIDPETVGNEDDEQFVLVDDEHEADDETRDDASPDREPSQHVQIFFCSRTHSQLSQAVNEVRRTVYGDDIRITTLASRQQYCINPAVRKLSSAALINERCLEMQKGCSSKATMTSDGCVVKRQKNAQPKHCNYYAQSRIQSTRDLVLTRVLDIEELVRAASETAACPYYAAKLAAKDAQVVMLSYQMLLHRRTRSQMGLDLRGSILIIDEGHNLMDTIASIYSNEVSLDQLRQASQQLIAYKKRYFTRFSTKNLLHLNQLIFIAARLVKILETPPDSKGVSSSETTTSRMVFPIDLMIESEFFTIRIDDILAFCERTHLAQKVHGFSLKYDSAVVVPDPVTPKPSRAEYLRRLSEKFTTPKGKAKQAVQPDVKESAANPSPPPPRNNVKESAVSASPAPRNMCSAIRPLLAFLASLIESHGDGRVLLSYSQKLRSKSSMKYIVLNPAGHFADALSECRAVCVCALLSPGYSTPNCGGYIFRLRFSGDYCRRNNATDRRSEDATV